MRNFLLTLSRRAFTWHRTDWHGATAGDRIFGWYAQAAATLKQMKLRPTARKLRALQRQVDMQQRQLQVRTVMDWIAQAKLAAEPLISVILPTRDRCQLLPRAIASVQAQSYANWELLVVDDASRDATPEVLGAHQDSRLRTFQSPGAGVCAARNVALASARGDLIAYLDDDNTMHPQWLKSVAWAFEQRPAANVVYGAFVVDDSARINRQQSGNLPDLYFFPYDHQNVAINNIADIGCIAHRARLAEATFDVTLREMGDWDLFLRLTRDAPPIALPAIACFYTTDAADRLSHGPTHAADRARVRRKNRR